MARAQTVVEETWNVITHGLGFLLFAAISIALFINADLSKDYMIVGLVVYCLSQLILYCASTTYHRAKEGTLKFKLRKLDHISIYGSIAGTYTPICLITLEQSSGWYILAAVWGIAVFGIIWKLFFTGKFEAFSSILYLVMGWLIVFDLTNLIAAFTELQMNLLIAGGIFFTVGIVFYVWNKLYFNHVIWHLFVLGGSISHAAMVWYVVV
ncbi:hemolysin III [Nonlabens dokdonensis]|uniref:Hemolysin III family channel protein n=2 Tax=Nonlabens dokdonensis TaxID=328515 RepID=L7W4X5_NONDD|nr:hemolysin III family protein [Nonlabens dokdonensis]AGC75154.1 hemolysin III family channel protein [Nonlabens dokdonensis DSW-6]PZX39102.1 hemolysin III [Nonlabens dokdonensis]